MFASLIHFLDAVQPWWVYKAGNDAHLRSVFRVASNNSNNSCLILVSQKPLQCKGEKDTAEGNQNRDWGRHIRLAQSEELRIQNTGNVPCRLLSAHFIFFKEGDSFDGHTKRIQESFLKSVIRFTFSLIFSRGNKKAKKWQKRQHQTALSHNKPKIAWLMFSF